MRRIESIKCHRHVFRCTANTSILGPFQFSRVAQRLQRHDSNAVAPKVSFGDNELIISHIDAFINTKGIGVRTMKMASNAIDRTTTQSGRQKLNWSIGATLSRTTMPINRNHLRHHATVYFQFTVSIVRMWAHVPIATFSASFLVDRRFLIDFLFCEWLFMPLRHRNFNAKSTRMKYASRYLSNVCNLYAPFYVGQKSNASMCVCVFVCEFMRWANEFIALQHKIFTYVFVHLWISGFRFWQLNDLFRWRIFLHDLSIMALCACICAVFT